MAKDPICGMDVDPATARHSSEYAQRTYYFCARGCKAAFDRNPAGYAGTAAEASQSGAAAGCACCHVGDQV